MYIHILPIYQIIPQASPTIIVGHGMTQMELEPCLLRLNTITDAQIGDT